MQNETEFATRLEDLNFLLGLHKVLLVNTCGQVANPDPGEDGTHVLCQTLSIQVMSSETCWEGESSSASVSFFY